ncbi:M1 family aminopeptidase [Zobellia sp.]|nr:M1 family aminopeptidase [Zobellia sp.]
MKIICIVLITGLLLLSCKEVKDTSLPLQDGVSLQLATYRKDQVSNINYKLSFQIPETKEKSIPTKLVIDLEILNLDEPLYLDFKEQSAHLKSIEANSKSIAIVHEHEHITISTKDLKIGKNTIEIDFIAGESSLNRNNDYLYTLLVPDRARTLFPCFDQPDIKATYTLDITTPKNWSVLSGAPELKKEEKNRFVRHYFEKTDLISTYLFSFVAGEFESIHENPGSFDMTLLYRETDVNKISYSTDTIFDLHQQSLSFLENYTSQPFPFKKMDFVAIPGFQYGGMEHVGTIQYNESSLFLDDTSTEDQKLRRLKLIAHETSHMWFGDLVTMSWFNDVWMKEVFANFMADKIADPAYPQINHKLAFMVSHYPRAYGEDRTQGANPIRQELNNLNNAGSLYGSIIYNKAPIMMRQLESVLGKEAFKKGIQEYIQTFSYSNATWNDLITILGKNTNLEIKKWSEVWVNSSGRPVFHHQIVYDSNENISAFTLNQKAEDQSYNVWPQTFDLALIYKDSVQNITVNMLGSSIELNEAIGKHKPLSILYNSNGMGYGVFPMANIDNEETLKIKDDVARGSMYINTYENGLNGKIKPDVLFYFLSQSLLSENNELLTALLSGYIKTIFWKYFSFEERTKHQPFLVDNLWKQLHEKAPANLKKILFSTFRSVAYSEDSKELLYKVWHKDVVIPNLNLNQDDYITMAQRLAIYNYTDYKKVLQEAEKAIDNPDKAAEFQFLLPSLSNDPKIRGQFFATLKDEKNRQKESWVLKALSNLNHPLREESSLKNLRASLDMLDEIQKTGDIFFPKRWLNNTNTIGLHSSAKAYSILNEYIAENKKIKPTLLNKLKQASDHLYRLHFMEKNIEK